MSENIQAISQGNYILHNIDAKKLYVQEPLFTANSGDAVYVGWRPDETVLWSGNGTQTTGSLNLSESTTGFERIGISFFGDTSPQIGYQEFPVNSTADSFPIITCDPHMEGSTVTMYIKWGLITQSNAGSTLNLTSGGYNNIYGSNKGSGNSCNWTKPFKIVGINRKENA